MTMRTRLKRLETAARRIPPARDHSDNRDDEDWLELFAVWGQDGRFDHEPDFPTALAFYQDAIQRAQAQTDPPFDPPPDFLPNLRDAPHVRRRAWRNHGRFPEVYEGWDWLAAILLRVLDGVPPVSTAEFEELARWFSANEARLYQLSAPSYSLDVGAGRTLLLANLRYELRKGVRTSGSGQLAEDLRRLRTRFGEGPT
jgi:hypothetical protein